LARSRARVVGLRPTVATLSDTVVSARVFAGRRNPPIRLFGCPALAAPHSEPREIGFPRPILSYPGRRPREHARWLLRFGVRRVSPDSPATLCSHRPLHEGGLAAEPILWPLVVNTTT